jgi:hypothetical protein
VDPLKSLKDRYAKIQPFKVPEGSLDMGTEPDPDVAGVSFSEPAGYPVNPEKLQLLEKAKLFQLQNKVDLTTALKAVGVK